MKTILELRNVSKIYETKAYALNQVNLKIKKHSLNLVLGHSGSGKSTLINLASLLDTPTQGDILINGKNTSQMSESEKTHLRHLQTGIVYQRDNLFPYLTLLENVMIPMVPKDANKAAQIIRTMEINDISKFPQEISVAQQQRVALSRALINNPSLILGDEPTGELNTEDTKKFLDYMLYARNKAAVLMVSNNPDISEYFGHVYALKDGSIKEI